MKEKPKLFLHRFHNLHVVLAAKCSTLAWFIVDVQHLLISLRKGIMFNWQCHRTVRLHETHIFKAKLGIESCVCQRTFYRPEKKWRWVSWLLPSISGHQSEAASPQSCSYHTEFRRIRAAKRITSWLGSHFVQHICSQMAFISHSSCTTEWRKCHWISLVQSVASLAPKPKVMDNQVVACNYVFLNNSDNIHVVAQAV